MDGSQWFRVCAECGQEVDDGRLQPSPARYRYQSVGMALRLLAARSSLRANDPGRQATSAPRWRVLADVVAGDLAAVRACLPPDDDDANAVLAAAVDRGGCVRALAAHWHCDERKAAARVQRLTRETADRLRDAALVPPADLRPPRRSRSRTRDPFAAVWRRMGGATDTLPE